MCARTAAGNLRGVRGEKVLLRLHKLERHEGAMPISMIQDTLRKIGAGEDLTRAEADGAMEPILSGHATDSQITELLGALRIKGETVDELVGFATAMRRHATKIFPSAYARRGERLVDTCGTGGDAKGTFNVSTAAAFVVAGAGVR